MANKKLFKSNVTSVKKVKAPKVTPTNTINLAGGTAYKFSDKHSLAQLASTGCFGNTFYADAENQLVKVTELANKVDPAFLAKIAIVARQKSFMKDMPATLAAILAKKDINLLKKVFKKTIDDMKMARNFVQIIRSGVTGRKSLGTAPKNLLNNMINSMTAEQLLRASVGNDPSLSDVIKLTHPTPANAERAALYGYLTGKEAAGPGKPLIEERVSKSGKPVVIHRYNPKNLPKFIKDFEAFKKSKEGEVPAVDFRLLDSVGLSPAQWAELAVKSNWHTVRMNLNTFARHGVFTIPGMADSIAQKLADAEVISKVKVFPYQLMAAYMNADSTVPQEVTNALQQAMEYATNNIPKFNGKVYVLPDVSGSMSCAITGNRGTSTSKMRCIDVAALIAASVARVNPSTEIIPFESDVISIKDLKLNPMDSIMTNAQKLASVGGGGTNCSAPLTMLNNRKATGDLVIYISDNESWVDSNKTYGYRGTETLRQFDIFKQRNPNAKLVCIDLTPNSTTQAGERTDILNIGGFSDNVFEVIAAFTDGGFGTHWVDVIEKVELD